MKPLLSILTFYFTVLFCFSQTQYEKKTTFLEDLQIYPKIVEPSHSGMYLYQSKTAIDMMFKVIIHQNLKE